MTAFDALTLELPDTPPWPEWLPDHLSASQLSMLERCPEQYRHRYVLGEKEPPSAALVWGTVDGKAHAAGNLIQKIESHEDAPVSAVKEAFATIFDEEVDERGGAGEIDWRDDKPAQVKDRGVALVAHYHEKVSPSIQPTAIEEPISITIPGVPVPYVGYIDVSTETCSLERKTASQSSKTIPPQYQLQTLGYALARHLPVEVHISTRTMKPAVYTPADGLPDLELGFDEGTVARAEASIRSRARLLASLCETFGPDEPWPDGIGTMAWHVAVCDLCGFRSRCTYWGAS